MIVGNQGASTECRISRKWIPGYRDAKAGAPESMDYHIGVAAKYWIEQSEVEDYGYERPVPWGFFTTTWRRLGSRHGYFKDNRPSIASGSPFACFLASSTLT
jgi:hypothetical protein